MLLIFLTIVELFTIGFGLHRDTVWRQSNRKDLHSRGVNLATVYQSLPSYRLGDRADPSMRCAGRLAISVKQTWSIP